MAFMTQGVQRTISPPVNVMHVVDVLGLAGMEFGVMKLVNGLAKMLPEYYHLRGWTPDGVPTAATLSRLTL